jgi:hypothetical protein
LKKRVRGLNNLFIFLFFSVFGGSNTIIIIIMITWDTMLRFSWLNPGQIVPKLKTFGPLQPAVVSIPSIRRHVNSRSEVALFCVLSTAIAFYHELLGGVPSEMGHTSISTVTERKPTSGFDTRTAKLPKLVHYNASFFQNSICCYKF